MEVPGKRAVASEELLHTCDTCMDRRSVTRAAHGYCIECRLYLCEGCFDVHRDPPPCRNHSLLEGKQTPKERLPPVDMCEAHTDEKINYFCKGHSVIACQKCVILQHRLCTDVCDIATVSGDSKIDQRYMELIESINGLESKIDERVQRVAQNLEEIQTIKNKAKADVKQFCNTMREHVDKLEKAMKDEIDQSSEEDVTNMDEIQQAYDSLNTDLKVVSTMVETSQSSNQKDQLFIATEKVTMTLKALDGKLAALSDGHLVVTDYRFAPDCRLEAAMADVQKLGQLVIGDRIAKAESSNTLAAPRWSLDTVTAETDNGIYVRTETDKKTCRIIGSTMLAGGTTLAIADCDNSSIKLVDVVKKKVLSQISLQDKPCGIAQVKSDQLAVTLPNSQKIQFLLLANGTTMSQDRQINASGKCCGIAHSNDRLFISFVRPKQVQIFSMSGSVLKTINAQTDGRIKLTCPLYLTLSLDQSMLYVCDCNTDTIYCLDVDGVVKSIYKDKGLRTPQAVCTAEDGTLIVCGDLSHNLYVISSDCTTGRVLVDKSRGVQNPYSVTYSSALSAIYIGLNTDTIALFKLK